LDTPKSQEKIEEARCSKDLTMLRELLAGLESQRLTAEQHVAAVSALSAEAGHSIVALESSVDVHRYTCAVHAFGFAGDASYEEIARWSDPDVFASPDFVHWLIEKHLLEPRAEDPDMSDALVIYLDKGRFKHIGIAQEAGRVESKWGTHALYNHGLWEVPSIYGNELLYFKRLTYEEALTYLQEFAREQGVEFDDDDDTT
jgi:hypothetical protein